MRAELDARRVWLGLRDALPLVPSTLLLGAIFGAAAQAAGLGQAVTIPMSALVFSGSGQFAALPLWQESLPVIFLSVLVLALRFALMTASMAPRLAGAPAWLRAAPAYGVPKGSRATHRAARQGCLGNA